MTEQQNTRPSASREIAVKPLVWKHRKPPADDIDNLFGEVCRAETLWGEPYIIYDDSLCDDDGYIDDESDTIWFYGNEFHQSVDAAKAAAQADYERRILSAIDTTPGNTDPMLIAKYDDELRKVQGGWRDMDDPDIEEIKKDGTDVLVYSIEGIELAWWADGQSAWMTRDGTYVPAEPTHWMPLPSAPTEHPTERFLARNQSCGCIVCTCEDDEQCQGCGAKSCGNHPVGEFPDPVILTAAKEQPSVSAGAVDALAAYQQADQDGIMVLVSRQAIEECLPALRSLAHEGE